MGKNPSHFSASGGGHDAVSGLDTDQFPVEMVSWDDATEFCLRLSNLPKEKAAGRWYRLPTEAQWEYACRVGSQTKWHFGNQEMRLGDYGWFNDKSTGRAHAVGELKTNPWGLYDMYGNVREWCQDLYGNYGTSPVEDNPGGPPVGETHPNRGGCFDQPAWMCRSSYRHNDNPGTRDRNVGFRVSLVLADPAAESHVKPVPLDLKPDAKAWDLKPGSPLNPASLVLKPAAIKGLRSWTLETCRLSQRRGYRSTQPG